MRRRIETVVQRTLRRQAQEFLERPFVGRRAQIYEFAMEPRERSLYDDVTAYLLEPQLLAFRGNQRQLLLIGFHRLMGSSIAALAASLRKVAQRLQRLLETGVNEPDATLLEDLDFEDIQAEVPQAGIGQAETDEKPPSVLTPVKVARNSSGSAISFSAPRRFRATVRPRNARGHPHHRRTSARTAARGHLYRIPGDPGHLRQMLVARGGYVPEAVTLFRGPTSRPEPIRHCNDGKKRSAATFRRIKSRAGRWRSA